MSRRARRQWRHSQDPGDGSETLFPACSWRSCDGFAKREPRRAPSPVVAQPSSPRQKPAALPSVEPELFRRDCLCALRIRGIDVA